MPKNTYTRYDNGAFACDQDDRFTYHIKREQYDIITEVMSFDEVINSFKLSFANGSFLLYMISNEEANMSMVIKKAHSRARKVIQTHINQGL